MYYELLRSLYLGEGTNADLTSAQARRRLHVATDLDKLIPLKVEQGMTVVVTGNPGDGKSHLVRLLMDMGRLSRAEVLSDLSAVPEREAVAFWRLARAKGHPLVLCANEGPLVNLLPHLDADAELAPLAAELRSQLGRLVGARETLLAPVPREALLIDLGDRNLLDEPILEKAIKLVTQPEFLPPGAYDSDDTDAGRNLLLFGRVPSAAKQLARVLALAAQRTGEHVSFRSLWSGISWALTRGRMPVVSAEAGTNPLDNLVRRSRPRAQGLLPKAVSQYADPASCPLPDLDEALWTIGRPEQGKWLTMEGIPTDVPARLWQQGRTEQAMDLFASLKRLVVLAHEEGDKLLDAMSMQNLDLPSMQTDSQLLVKCLLGLQRLYLPRQEEPAAPRWLLEGLPVWTNLSYRDVPAQDRPHVAIAALEPTEFELLRPKRVPWLVSALGPPPEVAWLSHRLSGIGLRLTPELLACLRLAASSSGPLPPPEPVQRFMARLSGWEESQYETLQNLRVRREQVAFLQKPRGALLATATVILGERGYAYGLDHPGQP